MSLAAERGWVPALKCLLDCPDIDINKVDEHSRTPLHYAAEKGHLPVVLLLLQRQAAWDVLSDTQNTLLHMAAQVRKAECVGGVSESAGGCEELGVRAEMAGGQNEGLSLFFHDITLHSL